MHNVSRVRLGGLREQVAAFGGKRRRSTRHGSIFEGKLPTGLPDSANQRAGRHGAAATAGDEEFLRGWTQTETALG